MSFPWRQETFTSATQGFVLKISAFGSYRFHSQKTSVEVIACAFCLLSLSPSLCLCLSSSLSLSLSLSLFPSLSLFLRTFSQAPHAVLPLTPKRTFLRP